MVESMDEYAICAEDTDGDGIPNSEVIIYFVVV